MKYKTKKVSCPDCRKKEPNQIIFSSGKIAHLRCPVCDGVNPFSVEPLTTETPADASEDMDVIEAGDAVTIEGEEAVSVAEAAEGTNETVTAETGADSALEPQVPVTASEAVEDGSVDDKPEPKHAGATKPHKVFPRKEKETEKVGVLMAHSAVMENCTEQRVPYAASKDYFTGDCLYHKLFGDGYVLTVLPSQKMSVLFADQKRLLRCGPNSQKEALIQFWK